MDKNANSLVYLIYRHVGIKLKKKAVMTKKTNDMDEIKKKNQ